MRVEFTGQCRSCSATLTDTRRRHCADCQAGARSAYKTKWMARKRASNPEAVKAYADKYRERNNELARKRKAAIDPVIRHEKERLYRLKNPEGVKQRQRKYYQRFRDLIVLSKREKRRANPELTKEYYCRNRTKILAYDKSRRADRTANQNKRRALEVAQGPDSADIKRYYRLVRDAKHIQCYWCGKDTAREERNVDHIVPLARGGKHEALNLCCSCKGCNMSKGARHPNDFARQLVIA